MTKRSHWSWQNKPIIVFPPRDPSQEAGTQKRFSLEFIMNLLFAKHCLLWVMRVLSFMSAGRCSEDSWVGALIVCTHVLSVLRCGNQRPWGCFRFEFDVMFRCVRDVRFVVVHPLMINNYYGYGVAVLKYCVRSSLVGAFISNSMRRFPECRNPIVITSTKFIGHAAALTIIILY